MDNIFPSETLQLFLEAEEAIKNHLEIEDEEENTAPYVRDCEIFNSHATENIIKEDMKTLKESSVLSYILGDDNG